jgi:ferredoxin--NADP+ reductase
MAPLVALLALSMSPLALGFAPVPPISGMMRLAPGSPLWMSSSSQQQQKQQQQQQQQHVSPASIESKRQLLSDVKTLAAQVEHLRSVVLDVQAARSAHAASSTVSPLLGQHPVASAVPPPEVKPVKKAGEALVCAAMLPPTSEFVAAAAMNSLEVEPFWDTSRAPQNTFRPSQPYIGRVLGVHRLTGPNATGEVCHVTIDHGGMMPYWEGQSMAVTPVGEDARGRPHKARLYSIASSRYGDDGAGTTVTLCVRRARYTDPETGLDDPSKAGVCSNFLCDSRPGDEVTLTGPTGKVLLMPESEQYDTDIIMVGTGTGVAPFRGFLRRLFFEDTPAARAYRGEAWLFLGVANSDALLYHDDWLKTVRRFPFNFRYTTALSREQTNKKGGKM